MSQLTMARLTPQRLDATYDTLTSVPLASGATVFVGGVVVVQSGYGKRGQTATGLKAVGVLVNQPQGVSAPSVTSTLQGFPRVNVCVGTFKLDIDPLDPVTQADLLTGVYLTDDQTICRSPSGGKSFAGLLVDIDDSSAPDGPGAWVKFGFLPTSAPAPTGLFLP